MNSDEPNRRSHAGREIADARGRLDGLDQQIIRLLKERVSISAVVQTARTQDGGCRTDSRRESAIVERYGMALDAAGSDIGRAVLRLCRGAEPAAAATARAVPVRRAFLGPAGSVSHHAAREIGTTAPEELVPLETLEKILQQLTEGAVDEAVLPLENTASGPVTEVMTALAAEPGIGIAAQTCVPTPWVLAGAAGTAASEVHAVASHPHALSQATKLLQRHAPDAMTVPAASTAAAAAALLTPAAPYEAAICSRRAAEHYGLNVLAALEEGDASSTRFALARRNADPPAPSGQDTTSLALTVAPGQLTAVLGVLADSGAEVLGLHSLPTGGRDHRLWLDVQGHVAGPASLRTLSELRTLCEAVHPVGCCPATSVPPHPIGDSHGP